MPRDSTQHQQHQQHRKVAIIGCGITGALAASTLIQKNNENNHHTNNDQGGLTIHVFDQGRGGVGGRASTRSFPSQTTGETAQTSTLINNNDDETTISSSIENVLRWDHGCQFFRADTPRFQCIVQEWIHKGYAKIWNGNFTSIRHDREDDEEETSNSRSKVENEFFGLPSRPPFYVGSNGMQSLITNVIDDAVHQSSLPSSLESSLMHVFTGTRVAKLQRLSNNKWKLYGNCGITAYHDTPEQIIQQQQQQEQQQQRTETYEDGKIVLGDESGYDIIILTDISSSFESWHRASAGVPSSFASSVRERVGARVPLFTTMIAYDTPQTKITFDAVSFIDHPIIWFAAKSNSKPGMMQIMQEQHNSGVEVVATSTTTTTAIENNYECWTIVSTPEYAMIQIESTPMQNEKTGEFIPQSRDYLTSVPGPEMVTAFESVLLSNYPNIGPSLPKIVHLDAQRWGSALPCARQLTIHSLTRKVISGVPYDSGRYPLAPTTMDRHKSELSYLADESLMLFQAGDMMSSFTPGFEGAALSGCDVAERVAQLVFGSID